MMQEGNPRFKPGQLVTVREWDDMAASFPAELVHEGWLDCPAEYDAEYVRGETPVCLFDLRMKYLCGTRVMIREAVWLESFSIYAYRINNDSFERDKFFVETMFDIGRYAEELTPGDADELFDFLLKGDGKP